MSAYDSWTFEKAGYAKQYATEVNVGVTSYFNLNFKKVCNYVGELIKNPNSAEPTLEELELKGRLLNDYDTKHINNVVENSGDLSWTLDNGKRKLCALFSQGIFGSKAFATLLGKVDNGVVFRRQPDGNWTLSLYNVSDGDTFNCGAYMKQNYGGGGHVGAAGGTITEDKFIEILKKKKL